MIRLEGGGSDCPMGMSFWGKDVNTAYTRSGWLIQAPNKCFCMNPHVKLPNSIEKFSISWYLVSRDGLS